MHFRNGGVTATLTKRQIFHFDHGYRNRVIGCFYMLPSGSQLTRLNTTSSAISRHKWLKSEQQQLRLWEPCMRQTCLWTMETYGNGQKREKNFGSFICSWGYKSRKQSSCGVMHLEKKKNENEKETNPPFIFQDHSFFPKEVWFLSLLTRKVKE